MPDDVLLHPTPAPHDWQGTMLSLPVIVGGTHDGICGLPQVSSLLPHHVYGQQDSGGIPFLTHISPAALGCPPPHCPFPEPDAQESMYVALRSGVGVCVYILILDDIMVAEDTAQHEPQGPWLGGFLT
jgi:hypothetical protein